MSVWWKIAAGAVAGYVVGSFASPGYTLWVTAGILAGCGLDVWLRKRGQSASGDIHRG